MLEAVGEAPNLYESASRRFPSLKQPFPVDVVSFEWLLREEFIQIPRKLCNDIERFRLLDEKAEKAREEIKALHHQTRGLLIQKRRLEKKGVLSFKGKSWAQESRKEEIDGEIEALILKRKRAGSNIDKAGAIYQKLLERIYQDQALRAGYWFAKQPLLLKHSGRFLLNYLKEMNSAHFQGRTLAEILEIGHSLA